jgi:hypothetical protein
MLMAASLPFALALVGVGAWGIGQKHKADHLAAAVAHEEAEIQRMAAQQARPAAEQPLPAHVPAAKGQPDQVLLMGQAAPRNKPKELVIPVQRSADPNENLAQSVKAR